MDAPRFIALVMYLSAPREEMTTTGRLARGIAAQIADQFVAIQARHFQIREDEIEFLLAQFFRAFRPSYAVATGNPAR